MLSLKYGKLLLNHESLHENLIWGFGPTEIYAYAHTKNELKLNHCVGIYTWHLYYEHVTQT